MHAQRKGVLLVAAAALLWSTGGLGIKAVAEPALKVTFYRSLFAAIALMIFLPRDAWATRRWSSTPAFIAAIVSYAACLTTFVIATKWTTAATDDESMGGHTTEFACATQTDFAHEQLIRVIKALALTGNEVLSARDS